jgi:hypothetical protein
VNVGIDPGTPEKHKLVFAWQTDAGRWELDGSPPAGIFDVAAVEGQIMNKGWSRQSLNTLGFWAGAPLFAVNAAVHVVLPPRVWKEKIIRGGSTFPKAVFCRWVVKLFKLPAELDPEDDSDQDTIDAIGIYEASKKLTPKELKTYARAFRQEPRTIFQRTAR